MDMIGRLKGFLSTIFGNSSTLGIMQPAQPHTFTLSHIKPRMLTLSHEDMINAIFPALEDHLQQVPTLANSTHIANAWIRLVEGLEDALTFANEDINNEEQIRIRETTDLRAITAAIRKIEAEIKPEEGMETVTRQSYELDAEACRTIINDSRFYLNYYNRELAEMLSRNAEEYKTDGVDVDKYTKIAEMLDRCAVSLNEHFKPEQPSADAKPSVENVP